MAPPLHQQVENLALVVDRSPEPESSAGDQNRHLVEMPSLGLFVAFTGHWDEGNALAEKALKLAGPSAAPTARDTRIVHNGFVSPK